MKWIDRLRYGKPPTKHETAARWRGMVGDDYMDGLLYGFTVTKDGERVDPRDIRLQRSTGVGEGQP